MLGETVKYNGFKNTPRIDTVPAICYATCIGYDETYIYTGIVTPKDKHTRHPQWDENFNCTHIVTEFRVGFHRSRLIAIVKDAEPLRGNFTQQTLF